MKDWFIIAVASSPIIFFTIIAKKGCRFQQAYYEENTDFADTIAKLEAGIAYEINNYKYSIILEPFNDSENNLKTLACCMAEAKIPGIETYL